MRHYFREQEIKVQNAERQKVVGRFPDAEVWGVDVGGPMVRYAHMKAADMGVAVNFAQRLAENTGFPANHFDLVVSNLVFHEVSEQGAKNIIKAR